MNDHGDYISVSSLIGSYIDKISKGQYEPVFAAKLMESSSEEGTSKFFALCGKELSSTQWQFFAVEGLVDFGVSAVKTSREFQLKDLRQVATNCYQEAFAQLTFDAKTIGLSFEKKKPRDAMLWCLLTLFYKVRGKYPELDNINFEALDKLAEKDKFKQFHKVFRIDLELNPDVLVKSTKFSKNYDPSDDEEDKGLGTAESSSERLELLNSLSNSKDLKEDYKLIQKKFYVERQKILERLVKCIEDKEGDKNKLLNFIAKIDEMFNSMQQSFRTPNLNARKPQSQSH